MATPLRHPLTGVELNPMLIERPALNLDEAVTVWVMRLGGTKYQTIAAMLGTNTHRVGEVLRGESYPEAEGIARARLYR